MKVIIEITIQTLLAFFGIWFITRILGKKQVAQLTVYEYVNGITFGSIAATLATDLNQRTWHHLIGLFLFGFFTFLMSYLSMKSTKVDSILQGGPIIVVEHGKILESNLKRCMYTVNDLLEQLRIGNVFDVAEVKYAIVESNGSLSIMKYENKETPTVSDLGLVTNTKDPFSAVIINGKIQYENLQRMNINEEWLNNQLMAKGISHVKDVMYASVNKEKQIYIDLFQDKVSGNEKTPL